MKLSHNRRYLTTDDNQPSEEHPGTSVVRFIPPSAVEPDVFLILERVA